MTPAPEIQAVIGLVGWVLIAAFFIGRHRRRRRRCLPTVRVE